MALAVGELDERSGGLGSCYASIGELVERAEWLIDRDADVSTSAGIGPERRTP